MLTIGDPELARHFLREFARLTGQPATPAADPTVQRVLRRLAVIQSLLTLHETEDLPKHLDRLAAEPLPDPRLAAVLAALRAHRYAEATDLLHAFVAAHAQVRRWEDPRLAALHLAIRRLEAERAEATRLLTAFEVWHQRELGELLKLRRGLFTTVSAPNSGDLLQGRCDALATRHAELLRELADLRVTQAYQLAQADEVERENYRSTNRAALLAERERLRAQLEPLVSIMAD